ncbi:MAG: hypothetical protein JNL18_06965 [Planctomycetaceae bacterium]|nr:hypothetical protein [Planctomycetaceae bacterium]
MANSTDAALRRSPLNAFLPRWFLMLLIPGACIGCSKSPHDLAPVRGVVTVDGKPFAAGKVMFAPVAKGESRNAGRAAFGRLQPDGSFTLTSYDADDGAVVGDHWATLIRLEDASLGERPSASPASALPPFSRVTYSQRITVLPNQENKVTLAFTTQEIVRYAEQDD